MSRLERIPRFELKRRNGVDPWRVTSLVQGRARGLAAARPGKTPLEV